MCSARQEKAYDRATLEGITGKVKAIARIADETTGLMDISIDLDPTYVGSTVFAMQQTWLNAMDLLSDGYIAGCIRLWDEYRNVPLDGTALDGVRLCPVAGERTLPGAVCRQMVSDTV